jgi:oligopeptidase B
VGGRVTTTDRRLTASAGPRATSPAIVAVVSTSHTAPSAARHDFTHTEHGVDRVDPYHWLGDLSDPAVRAHIDAENAYVEAVTAPLADLRERLYQEILARTQEDDLSVPARRGDWWYFTRVVEGGQYPILCRCPAHDDDWTPPATEEGALPGEVVMLDGNVEATGHGFFALGAAAVSPCAGLLAYSVDVTGDERHTLRIKDLRTGQHRDDEVAGLFYGVVWSADSASLFYVVVDEAWRPYEVRRHVLGQPAENDTVIYTEPDERFWVDAQLSASRRYLIVGSASKTTSEQRVLPLDSPDEQPVLVAARRDGIEYDVDHVVIDGRDRLLITHNGPLAAGVRARAVDFCVALADIGDTDPEHWVPLIEHEPGTRILGASAFDRAVVVALRRGGLPRVRVLPLGAGATGGPMPGVGAGWEPDFDEELFSVGVGDLRDPTTPVLRLTYTSYVRPATVYDLDLTTRQLLWRKQTPVLGGFDADDYEQRRAWASAEDGTAVPISLVARRGVLDAGPAPTLVYGYGAYETSMDPTFRVPRLSLLDRGVVFAVAHVRGGGELGRHWYEGGRLGTKRNTFTDFVSCARHLVASGVADEHRMVAMGGSAGGLLMGAVANLAPRDFAGILAQVPFVDALTTILDPSLPLTVIEWDEWGDPMHDRDAFDYILSYSPYDQVSDTTYPPILATTSLHDTRVRCVEPLKWIARLRAEAPSGGPYLVRTVIEGGHGGASGRYETWRETAFEFAWVLDRLALTQVPAGTAVSD